MKIVIPTYDRYNDFKTIMFLEKHNVPVEDVYIFVANEEQKILYNNVLKDKYKLIVGKFGLVEQRNFITDYFEENEILVSIDDDINDLKHKDDKPFLEWVNECITFMLEQKLGLVGINPSINKFFFDNINKDISFKIGRYLAVGAFQILINHKDLKLHYLTEDWERSLLYLKKYGNNIRYVNILIDTKYFNSNGGLSAYRNKYNYLNSVNKLLYLYNEYLTFNYKKLPALDKHILFPNLKAKRGEILNKTKEGFKILILPKIDCSEFLELYGMLESISIPKKSDRSNRMNFPEGHRATTFGYIRGRYNGKYDLSYNSKKYPHIYEEILRLGKIYVPFEFTAIHVNKNVVCPKHMDSGNVGESCLISFGDYTGCNIFIEDKKYDAFCQPIIFNGAKMEHYNSDDLVGNKYSLVFFSS